MKVDTVAVRKWVESNAKLIPSVSFTADELDHISMCAEHLLRHYLDGYPVGDFLTAVTKNDFLDACFQADDTNRKALYLYALFIVNKIPASMRRTARIDPLPEEVIPPAGCDNYGSLERG